MKPASFRGSVVASVDQAPVSGADVWTVSQDRHARTDTLGRFRFDTLSPGRMLLEIRRLGYDVLRDTVTLASGNELTRDYTLMSNAARLDTVRITDAHVRYVSAMLRGFEERRLARGGGHFVSDSALRRNEQKSLADVVTSHIPGVMLNRAHSLVSTRKQCRGLVILGAPRSNCKSTGVSDCYVAIYLDGALLYSAQMADAGASPPDATRMGVTDLAGIEFYADGMSAPAGMHSSDGGCGTLWLWTREK